MAVRDFERVLNAVHAAGAESIDFLGGEPTLHPDLCKMIAFAVSRGIKVFVSTNGSDVSVLRTLSGRYHNHQVEIGISLHGRSVGPDLDSFIIERRPVLKSVCTAIRTIPEYVSRYLEDGTVRYFLIYFDPVTIGDLSASIPFTSYLDTLTDIRQKHSAVEGVYCGGFVPDLEREPELSRVRCPAGTTKVSVMPDGSVYPCYLFQNDPSYLLGNILSMPLASIMNHPLLTVFREFHGNRCPRRDCIVHPACHGGCPAVSVRTGHDIHAADPRCLVSAERAVYMH